MDTIPYKRPLGVTVRGIFYIIEGFVAIFCGVLLSTTSQQIETYLLNRFPENQISTMLQILDGGLSHVLAIWLLVAGGASMIIGIGVLKGKRWAWRISIIQTLLSVVVGLGYVSYTHIADPTSKLLGTSSELIIGIVIICYFFQPHVRAYFNRLTAR